MAAKYFGAYRTNSSFMHKLDPRIKIIGILVVSISMFWVQSTHDLLVTLILLLLCIASTKIQPKELLLQLLPACIFLLCIGLLNLLFSQDGSIIYSLGPLHLTDTGLMRATLFPARVLLVLAQIICIAASTTPTDIADGLDKLLSPLSKLGLPAAQLSFTIALMLRFIPILAKDYKVLSNSLALRGARLKKGGIKQRLSSLKALIVALIAASLRHAKNLEVALDARYFEPGQKRTRLKSLRFSASDLVATLILITYLLFIFL